VTVCSFPSPMTTQGANLRNQSTPLCFSATSHIIRTGAVCVRRGRKQGTMLASPNTQERRADPYHDQISQKLQSTIVRLEFLRYSILCLPYVVRSVRRCPDPFPQDLADPNSISFPRARNEYQKSRITFRI
jgi:hypothetical protein